MRLKLGDGFYFVDGYLNSYGLEKLSETYGAETARQVAEAGLRVAARDVTAEIGCAGALIVQDRDGDRSALKVDLVYTLVQYRLAVVSPFIGWNKRNPEKHDTYVLMRNGHHRPEPSEGALLVERRELAPYVVGNTDTPDHYERQFRKQFYEDAVGLLLMSEIGMTRDAAGMLAAYVLGGFHHLHDAWAMRVLMPPKWEQWKTDHPLKTAIDFVREYYEGGAQSILRKADPKGYKAFHDRCRYEGVKPETILEKGVFDPDVVLAKYNGVLPCDEELIEQGFQIRSREFMEVSRARSALAKRKSRGC